jgi:hypothetical protein
MTNMNSRLLSFFLAGITSFFIPFTNSLAKPNSKKPVSASNTLNLGNGIKFVFQGCTQISSQNKVICSGIFRNSNGEKPVLIFRDYPPAPTTITNSSGRNYVANEVRIVDVDNRTCSSENNDFGNACSWYDVTLVEGVEYKTLFIFNDVSLPMSKIPLLSIGFNYGNDQALKFRNIPVSVQN